MVERKGAGVGLEQLTCLKGQPVEESRSRNAWAWGLSSPHLPRAAGGVAWGQAPGGQAHPALHEELEPGE